MNHPFIQSGRPILRGGFAWSLLNEVRVTQKPRTQDSGFGKFGAAIGEGKAIFTKRDLISWAILRNEAKLGRVGAKKRRFLQNGIDQVGGFTQRSQMAVREATPAGPLGELKIRTQWPAKAGEERCYAIVRDPELSYPVPGGRGDPQWAKDASNTTATLVSP